LRAQFRAALDKLDMTQAEMAALLSIDAAPRAARARRGDDPCAGCDPGELAGRRRRDIEQIEATKLGAPRQSQAADKVEA
jgi:hypothetical protein